jgi:hypothetical protein
MALDPVTVALVTSVVSGLAGTNATALVAMHASEPSIVWIAGEAVALGAHETRTIAVPVSLAAGRSSVILPVTSGGVTYNVRVASVGKREARLLWWLPLSILPLALTSVRVRRVAGSSETISAGIPLE